MAYWIREIVGWILVLLGLAIFLYCLSFLEQGKIIEGGILTSIGVVVFRGGIHLIKVATAARIVATEKTTIRAER